MIHIQYSDGHQACFNYIKRKESFWNVTLTISKEKYVVLNCPGYTVCWSVSASIFVVVFVFPQLTARVVLKLQLQLLVLNGWEYENICVHTYGGRQGSTKMLSESQITHDSWWMCTDDGSRLLTERAILYENCTDTQSRARHFHQILPAKCLGRALHCAERCELLVLLTMVQKQGKDDSIVKTSMHLVNEDLNFGPSAMFKIAIYCLSKIFTKRAKSHRVFHDHCLVVM